MAKTIPRKKRSNKWLTGRVIISGVSTRRLSKIVMIRVAVFPCRHVAPSAGAHVVADEANAAVGEADVDAAGMAASRLGNPAHFELIAPHLQIANVGITGLKVFTSLN